MDAMGLAAAPLDSYQRTTVSTDFNGTTFSTSGVRWMKPDSIDIYVPEEGITATTWSGTQPEEGVLYDWPKLEEKDKYAFFLGGNKPLTVLETAHTDAPKLLVVRDSYSDSLAPFLTADFSEVHLFDTIRPLSPSISRKTTSTRCWSCTAWQISSPTAICSY